MKVGFLHMGAVSVLVSPSLALADTTSSFNVAQALKGAQVIDYTSGVVHGLYGTVSGYAWGLVPFLLILSLLFEAFLRPPNEGRNMARPVWRALLVIIVLGNYPLLIGTVIQSAQSVATQLVTPSVFNDFNTALQVAMDKQQQKDAEAAAGQPTSGMITAYLSDATHQIGGVVFSSLLTLLMLLCLASYAAFQQLSSVLVAFLYIVGPLAVAGSVLPMSNTGTRWFRTVLSIACWPLIAGILFQLSSQISIQWLKRDDVGTVGILLSGLGTLCISLVTPAMASALVGGTLGNALSTGMASLTSLAAKVPNPFPSMNELIDAKREADKALPQLAHQAADGVADLGRAGHALHDVAVPPPAPVQLPERSWNLPQSTPSAPEAPPSKSS